MTKYPKESKVRVRLWNSRIVNAVVLKQVWFMCLVEYQTNQWRNGEIKYITTDTRWYPIWRIYD